MLRETEEMGSGSPELEFDELVQRYYSPLYRFAFSLTQTESDALDLTQQTFYLWGTKGNQLRDSSKVKTWMFTTLHRAFLQTRRRQVRFPHCELGQAEPELPTIPPPRGHELDEAQACEALKQVDRIYRTPVALFYLEERPYKEIAEQLNVPLGTVKSRIARGLGQLRKVLMESVAPSPEAL